MIRKFSTKEILQQNLARSAPGLMKELVIFLHNIRSMHNVGAVFRNADAFGVQKLILSGVTPVPPRAEITKTAIGAEQYVKWDSTDSPVEVLQEMQQTHTVVGIEQTSESTLLPDFLPPDRPVCLVFGNEVTALMKPFFIY